MKKNLLILLSCFITSISFSQDEAITSRDILLNGNISYAYMEDFETLLAFGIGTEAKINQRFSLGGSITYGGGDAHSRLTVNPNIRFYPKQVFRGFFLSTGISYYQFRAKADSKLLGFPFDEDRGGEASFFTLHAGLGISTLVRDRWAISVSLALAGPFDDDIDELMIESNFTVGYAF